METLIDRLERVEILDLRFYEEVLYDQDILYPVFQILDFTRVPIGVAKARAENKKLVVYIVWNLIEYKTEPHLVITGMQLGPHDDPDILNLTELMWVPNPAH